MTKSQFMQDYFKQEEFVTVKATLLQEQLKANLQYERLLKQRDEEIRRLKIGMEFLREENKELKNAELQLQDVTNQLQKKNNHRQRLVEERAGIQFQQTEYIRQEKIRLQGEVEGVQQELSILIALKKQIENEWGKSVQALQEKEQQLIKQQQQQFDEQRSQIEQTIGKIRLQQTQVLAELQTESDRAMAEKGVDVATLRREEQKLQKLKKEQKISTRMMKAYETRLFALEIFSKTFIGKKS